MDKNKIIAKRIIAGKMDNLVKLKSVGKIGELDELGRIVVPKELRIAFGWKEKRGSEKGTCLDVSILEGYIRIKEYKPGNEAPGILRRLDALGRLVIPKQMANQLELVKKGEGEYEKGSCFEMFTRNNELILKIYGTSCYCCGDCGHLNNILERFICDDCLKELNIDTRKIIDTLR